jgi:hypothetical protein
MKTSKYVARSPAAFVVSLSNHEGVAPNPEQSS